MAETLSWVLNRIGYGCYLLTELDGVMTPRTLVREHFGIGFHW